jgi:hypothetical protein
MMKINLALLVEELIKAYLLVAKRGQPTQFQQPTKAIL